MSIAIGNHVRQWVSLPGGSCDMRIGADVLESAGSILKGAVGRAGSSVLAAGDDVPDELLERVRRQLTDAGFAVQLVAIESGSAARSLEATGVFVEQLAEAQVTSDDLIVVVGGPDTLSAAAYGAGSWCGGTPLAVVPTSLHAAVEAVATPRGIDVSGLSEALFVRACAKYALCDIDVMSHDVGSPETRLAYAQMVAGAVCDSERAFSALWDRAGELAVGSAAAVCDQLAETARARGHVAASASVSVRQSIAYGVTFARALDELCPQQIEAGVRLAEGMRFSARLAAGMGTCPVDDVFAQDELLELLGIGYASCELEAATLVDALRAERFRRTNRFMLEVPRSLGRVRLASVEEGLLREHAEAWCASRRELMARNEKDRDGMSDAVAE